MSRFFVSDNPITPFELRFVDEFYVISKIYEINKLGEFEIENHICSPLRIDNTPGCKWVKNGTNKYRFLDFSSNNTGPKAREIWQFVSELYDLDYYKSIELIINLANEENFVIANAKNFKKKRISRADKPTFIKYRKIPFTKQALKYWSDYNITEQDLKEDLVTQTNLVLIRKWVDGKYRLKQSYFNNREAYALGGFIDDKCKIYVPEPKMFITNLKYEIGNKKDIIKPSSDNIYITSSYKDHRVTKNALKYFDLYGDVIWLQNESAIPLNEDLELISKYPNICYLRDNDKAGEESFNNFCNAISMITGKNLDNITSAFPHNGRKDFAQLMKHDGYEEFKHYLI